MEAEHGRQIPQRLNIKPAVLMSRRHGEEIPVCSVLKICWKGAEERKRRTKLIEQVKRLKMKQATCFADQ